MRTAIYTRVSTEDPSCKRQVAELTEFAKRSGYAVEWTLTEMEPGAKHGHPERQVVMALAQARQIDIVLVTKLSRWGRSIADLIESLRELKNYKVSIIAMRGLMIDFASPHGERVVTLLSDIAEFERDLKSENVKSGLANSQNKGKKLGRPKGQPSPEIDALTPHILKAVKEGKSYRWIANHFGISKDSVARVVKKAQAESPYAGSSRLASCQDAR